VAHFVIVAAMLVDADAGRHHLADELDDMAQMLVEACGEGPREDPHGRECWAAMVAIWRVETGRTFRLYPAARGTGCGPGQVIPRRRFGNSRLGLWATPPCDGLRVPRVGLHWAVLVLRAKALRIRSWRARFRAYNGSHLKDRYAATALRTFRKVL